MSDATGSEAGIDGEARASSAPVTLLFVARATIGGALMGLANLVPGISGGTMLLATGVYPTFIASIAEISTLRLRLRPIVTLGTIATAAALAILLLAGTMKSLVVEQRWLMYSLFIGLTLGGVPLVWRLARPLNASAIAGAAAAFGVMVIMHFGASGSDGGEASTLLLFVSGLAGASAMILPGVSGGYLLLLLGQYEGILGAVDQVKLGLLGGAGAAPDIGLVLGAAGVVVPVGLGVATGVIGVSNLVKWLLERFEKPTLGVLLGLLFGAVVGLWPFQQPVPPSPGDLIAGQRVGAEEIASLDVDDWRVERFEPTGAQVAGSLALVALGLAATVLISRLGGAESPTDS